MYIYKPTSRCVHLLPQEQGDVLYPPGVIESIHPPQQCRWSSAHLHGDLDVRWICGYLDVWICGYVDIWICGYVNFWMCGCVHMWMCRCVDIWMCGCVDMWMWIYVLRVLMVATTCTSKEEANGNNTNLCLPTYTHQCGGIFLKQT